MPTPDPLDPGHIPGQNPNTPERLPGHTRYAGEHGSRRVLVAAVVIAAIVAAVVVGIGIATWNSSDSAQPSSTASVR